MTQKIENIKWPHKNMAQNFQTVEKNFANFKIIDLEHLGAQNIFHSLIQKVIISFFFRCKKIGRPE